MFKERVRFAAGLAPKNIDPTFYLPILSLDQACRHPRIAESLHAAREAPGRYEQLTAAFSQHDWDTIIFELKQTESNRSSA
jgi:hypothetical protein